MWCVVPNMKSMLSYIPDGLTIDLSTVISFAVLYFMGQNRRSIPQCHTLGTFFLPDSEHSRFIIPCSVNISWIFVCSGQKQGHPQQKMQIVKDSPDFILVRLRPVNTDFQEILSVASLPSCAWFPACKTDTGRYQSR